jgi:hypothetical protein
VASYFSISQRLEVAAVQEALVQHHRDLLQERDTLQQFTQEVTESAESYRESLQTLNPVITQSHLATQEVTGISSFAAQQTITSVGAPLQEVTVLAQAETVLQVSAVSRSRPHKGLIWDSTTND